jgi:peptidoglycan/LPS O-acetylase OafA/YrhL
MIPPTTSLARNHFLDALRGIAALLVLATHLQSSITGFYPAARRVIHAGKGVRLFLLKRFLRIFLPYWPIALALAAAYALLPGLSAAADPIQVNWLKSLTLIPGGRLLPVCGLDPQFRTVFLRSFRGFSRLPPACLALEFDLDSFHTGANTGFSYA